MGFPGGAAAKRLVLEAAGWILVVAGLAALVLPGPGLLMLFAGLVVLSQQYEWAERRLDPVERAAKRAAAEGVETWLRIALSAAGGLAIVGFGVLWLVEPAVPGWWPAPDSWWLPGAPAAGISLVLSGLIALGLLAYSFWKYRVQGVRPPESRRADDATD
ncbi:PGPGW domain-containing protein [Nocardioides sp. YIM 152315]|uniref:PGPGW domain-containing protein n=1 Tax=Nocardioides sp. YIM 152315 TaxID=3031760 RepID=UPI0023DACF8B|nr:PGPGW domain-containing protein [Nocardioides sp. YIM 152315]MDF1605338.1 PGPGW domain-containing protein [Nocardioides sp. YIM 152315]